MTIEPITTHLDGVSFQLKEQHDFEWLRNMGSVFCVFDQQDSGNISFGVERDGEKVFVKYAGARTIEYAGEPKEAIIRLKKAMPLYNELRHPILIELINHYEVGDGYAGVFKWVEGECLHSHWSFPPPAKYNHPDSPFFRLRQLPLKERLIAVEHIFSFHAHVESMNYVAIDFYDGSILYDFNTSTTKICDIDFYHQKPYINTMGRLWGSSRFMSPEEFELGAQIDARTNVFNMGATAFVLLGGEMDRSLAKWEAGKELFDIALQAVEKDRNLRYSSVTALYTAWQSAWKRGKE